MITDIEVKKAGKKGQGVFACCNFRKGEFIFRSRFGRLVTKANYDTVPPEEHRYLDDLDWGKWELMAAPARYINHSCDPNSYTKGYSIYALRDIKTGEEITGDYRATSMYTNEWSCFCGSKNCTGVVTANFFTLPPDKQAFYLPFAPKFIKQEYRKRKSKGSS